VINFEEVIAAIFRGTDDKKVGDEIGFTQKKMCDTTPPSKK